MKINGSVGTVAVLSSTMLACAAVLAVLAYSTIGLYRSLAQVRSIYEVDVKALSLDGELQYQTEESRHEFLYVLIPALDSADRLEYIDRVRKADLQVSLLMGRITILTSDRFRLRPFADAWARYIDIRDEVIALCLQGRFDEGLHVEKSQGVETFDAASEEIRRAKAKLEQASERKVQIAWRSLRRACFEVSGLLLAALLFMGGLLALETRRRDIVRQLRSVVTALSQREARFRSIFEEAAVGILVMDGNGKIVSANKAIAEITQYDPAEMIGTTGADFIAPDHRKASAEALARALLGDALDYRAERRIVRKDGRSAWIRISASVIERDGTPWEVIGLWEDITEQKLACERLNYQATHDSLTGVVNRRFFEDALGQAIRHARAQGDGLALLYLDLDGFKLVNDTMGHQTGDRLLRQVAERLQSCLSGAELLARVGGDEFAVIKPLPAGDRSSADLARRLLETFRAPFSGVAEGLKIGTSIGISHYPEDGENASELCQSADAAMFHAKRNGRGFRVFDGSMKQAMVRRVRIQKQIAGALERGEFEAHFQPLYDLAARDVVGFEALCRWRNPELGNVPPVEFIPIAEETGLINAIGKWMLREACIHARRWQLDGRSPIRVAVNVSAVQFARDDFVDVVRDILEETRFPPDWLELELTESVLPRDPAETIRKMRLLQSLGLSLSIDDFGTGYSSLSYLQSLPVKALKIDRSFTARIDSSAEAVTMIKSVIAMARTLGLRVVTEGIENGRQLDIIRRLGSHEGQGYYLGMPEDGEKTLQRVLTEAGAEVLV